MKKLKQNRHAKFRQPEGYYQQVITDPRHKKPSQRFREAMHAAINGKADL